MNKPINGTPTNGNPFGPAVRRFAHSLPDKLLELLVPLVCAGGGIFVIASLLRTRDPWAIVVGLVFAGVAAAVYMQIRGAAAQMPLEIRIENQRISLYRFRKYKTFSLDSIVSVLVNQKTEFNRTGRATVIEYEADGRRQRFHINPHISGYVDLVDILQEAVGDAALDVPQDSPSNAGATKSVFCWARSMRFGSVIFGPLMMAVGISFAVETLRSPMSIPNTLDGALGIAAIVSGISAMTRKIPICVEIGDESITFRYAIRSATEVRFSDIVGFDTGGKLGRFGTEVTTASLRLRNGRKVMLLTCFENYPGLMKTLQAKLEKHQGTSVT